MEAQEILNQALKEMDARGRQSKDGTKERSMAATVAAFNAITGRELTETEGWMFMVVLKAVRTIQRVGSIDSFVDGAAYFSLAGESAEALKNISETMEVSDIRDSKLITIDGKNYLIPTRIRFIAQDANGEWWGYDTKPALSTVREKWHNAGGSSAFGICVHDENLNYHQTLRFL